MSSDDRVYSARKSDFMEKMNTLLSGYSRVFVVCADNVGSSQMQVIRKSLRGKGVLLMGKNTMMRKAIKGRMTQNPALGALYELVLRNVGLVFTSCDIPTMKKLVLQNRVPAAAKVGSVAPIDVFVPAGSTGLDPGQTNYFQAMNIATKLTRGEIEILNDTQVIVKGEKVSASAASLLQKLKITPFTYGLEIEAVYDNGTVFSPAVLDLTDDMIAEAFLEGVQNIAAISLHTGYPTLPAVPHLIINGYKNVLAVAIETNIEFDQAAKIKAYIKNPTAFAAAAAPKSSADVPAKKDEKKKEEKKPEKKPEPEPEEDGDMGFSLFD